MSISHLYAETLSLNCSIWITYIYIFAVLTQAMRTRKTRRTFILSGTWWSPKRPLGKANGDSKLIYALSFFYSSQGPWENKNLYFPKEILLYIVVTMTRNTIREGGGPNHHPQMAWRTTHSPQSI